MIEFFSKDTEVYTPVPVVQLDEIIAPDEEDNDNNVISWTEVDQLFTGFLLGVNSLLDGPISPCQNDKN